MEKKLVLKNKIKQEKIENKYIKYNIRMKYVDIIIIGSGMAGLYSAYKIKNYSPNTSFLVLEKYKKTWIGGRTSNDTFYGTEIVTGAGIGRKSKDKLLYKLVNEFNIHSSEYTVIHQRSSFIKDVDVVDVLDHLKSVYNKSFKNKSLTFKEFASEVLGEEMYKNFVISTGYTDYENEDAFETLYYYGMEDNARPFVALRVPWKKLVYKLYHFIGENNFKFSSKVTKIMKIQNQPCRFLVSTESGSKFVCNKVIIATTIDGLRNLLPNNPIYNDIGGQTFLRLYVKFSKSSIPILMEKIKNLTFLVGPLQRAIPVDPKNGIYMFYNDNENALLLKNHVENNKHNRDLYETLIEKTMGFPENSLHIIALKHYYWPIGTHYYKPLNKELYKTRENFIHIAQNPEKGILVVGEVVSRNQGWTEGALQSVKEVVTKKWVETQC